MEENIYGFIPSKMDGTEHVFNGGGDIPPRYSYKEYMPLVLNQGTLQICVPCSVSAYLNWRENLQDGRERDNKIALMEIYKARTNSGEGMTFKDALHFLRHIGVNSKIGNLKITGYARVKTIDDLKAAIYTNGPCIGALPVYSSRDNFWTKWVGDRYSGGHAISLVGYDDDGFIIRNSWGEEFGDRGYTHIEYSDFNQLMEIWTIIE